MLDENIHCVSLDGTFDDCQNIVKELFQKREFNKEVGLGAVNSINWCRILAQIVYYFYGYFRWLESSEPGVRKADSSAFFVFFFVGGGATREDGASSTAPPPVWEGRSTHPISAPHLPSILTTPSHHIPSFLGSLGDCVTFAVPSGNFGNALAGFYAKEMVRA